MEFLFLLMFLDAKHTYNHYVPKEPIHIERTQEKVMWEDILKRRKK